MDEELIILETEEVVSDEVNIEDIEQNIEQETVTEYIEVDVPEEIDVEIEEGTGWVGGDSSKHYSLAGRNEPDQHIIESITGLRDELDVLASVTTERDNETIYYNRYSAYSGYAEFRPWKDKNPNQDERLGYFVSLVNNNDDNNEWIEICNKTSTDVYGVIVSHSGFCGKQSSGYNMLDEESPNRANNTEWAKVCLLGTVEARVSSDEEFNNIHIGDYVIPDINGCAKKSDNNIGFKVVMKEGAGTGVNGWNKVSISLVPQNDNVARVMEKLKETNENVGVVIGRLDGLEDTVNSNISISGDFKDLEEAFGKLEADVNTKFEIAETTYKTAQEISDEATKKMEEMTKHYDEALNEVDMAASNAQQALDQINDYDLKTLAEYKGNIVGFFTDASEDGVSVGTITKTQSDVSMIKQSSDALQHLVCHIDEYSVGKQSPTYGLSYNGTQGVLGTYKYIYVPIVDHWEYSPIYTCTPKAGVHESKYWFEISSVKYFFVAPKILVNELLIYNKNTNQLIIDKDENTKIELSIITEVSADMLKLDFENEKSIHFEINTETSVGKSYEWSQIESSDEFWWSEGVSVIHSENPPKGDYELWYTHNGVQDPDSKEYIYKPGTLYCKINSNWIAVATINDNNARTMSYINQTADEISSTITNVAGEVSTLEQTVDGISTTVNDNKGKLSQIDQTAENIRLGLYESGGGASSLELLLSGLRSDAVNTDHTFVCEILDITPQSYDENGLFYKEPPMWDGTEFSFDGITSGNMSDEFCYCPGEKANTYYEKTTTGYKVYTNGNQAIASLNTRVTDTESAVESWTQFQSEFSETMTKISQESTRDASELIAMVLGEFVHKVESVISPTEEQLEVLAELALWDTKPYWDKEDERFYSDGMPELDGKYGITTDGLYYYELTRDSASKIISYEKYGLKSSQYATIVQKVEDGESYVGLIAESDESTGSVIARTINNKSEVLIEADKISINGTTTFADALNPEKTAISGNYIKTGTIMSNNYSGPVIKRMYGTKIGTTERLEPSGNIICTFTTGVTLYKQPGTEYILSTSKGRGYVGLNLNFDEVETTNIVKPCYCFYKGKSYQVRVYTAKGNDYTSHEYSLSDLPIPDGVEVDLYPKAQGTGEYQYDRIIEGESTDYICYTPIVLGELSTENYCYAKDIQIEEELFTTPDDCSYIVSDEDFDLIPSDIAIEGMKLDLNVGTIYSKNLILDRDGNLTITGRIEATSGYIGDEENGFLIASDYIGNGQCSLLGGDDGESKGDPGVFISPKGIGTGHGRFYVPNTGMSMRVAGGEFSYINKWTDERVGELIDRTVFCISTFGNPDYVSIGRKETFEGEYHYSTVFIKPRTSTQGSEDGHVEVYGTMKVTKGVSQSSDSRLKTNIVSPDINALELLNNIETKSFDWINSGEHIDVGLIAQQLEKVIPNLVITDEETDLKSINFIGLIPYLVKAIQEISAMINPPTETISLMSNDEKPTHWVDDMDENEKQYYVELSRPPMFKSNTTD